MNFQQLNEIFFPKLWGDGVGDVIAQILRADQWVGLSKQWKIIDDVIIITVELKVKFEYKFH